MNTTTMSTTDSAASAPAGGSEQAAGTAAAPGTVGPREAGTAAASDLITMLADAGMSPDRIGTVIKDVLGCRHDQPTSVSEDFYDAFAGTAAVLVADLREPEAG